MSTVSLTVNKIAGTVTAPTASRTVTFKADAADKKVSTYVMLEFDINGHSLKEANEMLTGKIRLNDILGITRDGKLRLILSQASEKDIELILPRFEELDITVTVVK